MKRLRKKDWAMEGKRGKLTSKFFWEEPKGYVKFSRFGLFIDLYWH